MQSAAPRALHAEFTELEAFSGLMQDGAAENIQLGAGPLRLRLTLAEFGPLRLHTNAVDNDYLARAQANADRWAVFFDLGAVPGASRINGFRMGPAGAVLIGPGAELLGLAAKGQEWAMLTLAADPLPAMFDGRSVPPAGRATHLPDLLHRAPALRVLSREIAGLVRSDPGRLQGAAVADAVQESVTAALAAGLPGPAAAQAGVAGRREVRLVGAAIDYLEASLGAPVYTAAVAGTLGASPRDLNAAFRAVYGVTLQHYLLTRRLSLARQALREPDGPIMVKQVALNAGFWHFGRFALAYRRMFGETPSETLAGRATRSGFVPGVCAPRHSAHIKATR